MHNARIKRYPDGSAELLIGSRPFGGGSISRLPAYADDGDWPFCHGDVETAEQRSEREYAAFERDSVADPDGSSTLENQAASLAVNVQRAARRSRKTLRDLARSNDWKFFVTLTLDQEKVDRYDFDAVWKHLRHWLGNNVRRHGLTYILVPEHHKDGAIHFHGLFNDALPAVDSGTLSVPGRKAPVKARSEAHRSALEAQGAHPVYNLPSWGWGFSTAIELYGEKDAAVNYVCKYIGKENAGKIGGRWYYSGGDLKRPSVEWFDVNVRDWENVEGWFQPDDYPYASFLSMRITAEGEVLMPYFRKTQDQENSNVPRTIVSRETSFADESPAGIPDPWQENAEHESDSDHPDLSGGHDSRVPSTGPTTPSDVDPQSRVSSADPKHEQLSLFATSRPRAQSALSTHLTFSGLLNDRRHLLPQGPRQTAQKMTREYLSILEESL